MPKKESSRQQNIFDFLKRAEKLASQSECPAAGSLVIDTEFKEALAQDLRHASDENGHELSRYQVASRMSEYLGRDVTKEMLDNWTARSHPHNIPAAFMPAFRHATGGRRALEVIGKHAGLFVLPSAEAIRAEIHKLEEEKKGLGKEIKKRQFYLKEMEGEDDGA